MGFEVVNSIPTSDVDYYSDEFILDPYPFYKELRDFAPAVWLSLYDAWFISRYDDVTAGLKTPRCFVQAKVSP